MRIATYQAHNVLKISDIDFDLRGKHLFLVGGQNGHGKTSALKGILMALCGRSGMDYPEVALQEGQSEGWVKIKLDPDEGEQELTIELFLKRRRGGQVTEQFRIVDKDGREAPEPRALLKRLYQVRAFDPLDFERMDRKAKRELLQKLVGLDFAEQKKEYDKCFAERTAVNRDGKRLKAKVEGMPQWPGVPDGETSVAIVLQKRDDEAAENKRSDGEREKLKKLEDDGGNDIRRFLKLKEELAAIQEDIKERRVQISAQTKKVNALEDDYDLSKINQEVADIEVTNKKIRENVARRAEEAGLTKLRAESQFLTDKLDGIQGAQKNALQAAKWPVDGLSFDDEGVLFEGLPFEQASKSRRVLTSVLIGMALNPRLRLLVCQDGNDLDQDSIYALGKVLKEKDFQMIVEMVTRGDEDEARCAVVIENGRPKALEVSDKEK